MPALRCQAQSLERDLEQIEAQLKALRTQAATLDERVQKLEAITGVGTITALGVLADGRVTRGNLRPTNLKQRVQAFGRPFLSENTTRLQRCFAFLPA